MSLSYAAHINGDKVYDIATGYWIEAKQEATAAAGRMRWSVYLYDDEGEFVEKYADGTTFPENQADLWEFVGFDIATSASSATWHIFTMYNHSSVVASSGTSTTLKQYFSGEQGYAINADYAVIDVQPYSITENGTYTAPFSKAYSPVVVDVQEQPWQPLEDGYSNFWFELTDDTLSPWLNFSAKNNDAVIDWGDGSGEVALDTLTPTHTYAKAGKYVVKVKGVKGIAQQLTAPYPSYSRVLRNIELVGVETINGYAFQLLGSIENIRLSSDITTIGNYAFRTSRLCSVNIPSSTINSGTFYQCCWLNDITIADACTNVAAAMFYGCVSLAKITIPASVTEISANAFNGCSSLGEIHCKPTAPPTLGSSAFNSLPSNFIIYVPVGYGETYKAAAGWSTYADHILEEGQTPNRAMLSRLAKAVETDTDEDMR